MMEMTATQARLWKYIKSCERCPSFDEMQDAMGLHSKSGVHRLIEALERKGFIHCARRSGLRVHRGITIHASPRPDLAGYRTGELLDELARRNPVNTGETPAISKSQTDANPTEQSVKPQARIAA